MVEAVKERTLYLQSWADLPGRKSSISFQISLDKSLKLETFLRDENFSTR
jgi:hypothetical protein